MEMLVRPAAGVFEKSKPKEDKSRSIRSSKAFE